MKLLLNIQMLSYRFPKATVKAKQQEEQEQGIKSYVCMSYNSV